MLSRLTMFKTMRSSLAAQVMVGTILSFLLFGCVVAYIGNNEVTEAVEEQYVDAAYRSAITALMFLDPEKLADYAAMDDARWAEETKLLADRWNRIAENQDCMLIYAVPVEPEYENIRSNERVSVALSVRSFKADVSPELKKAWRGEISIRGNRKAYLDILERGRPWSVIFRPQTKVLGPHLTLMVPIKTQNGEIKGILSVQREMGKLKTAQNAHARDVFIGVAVLLAFILPFRMWMLRRMLVEPVRRVTQETRRFAREDTLPAVPLGATIRMSNEIGQLARSIDAMEADNVAHVSNLLRVTAEKEQIQAELNVATQIQADMLPRIFPPFPDRREFDIYATMTPAKEVGGDFYDFFFIDENHLALIMADVSGKGVPAALFMVVARTLIKNRAQMGGTPSEILKDVNAQLCDGNEAGYFVTVWLSILELSTGHMTAANAGHEYPAVKRRDGAYELIKTKNSMAVAVTEMSKFRDIELELHPGDTLYLYTDGVAEAMNTKNELYGTDRMIDALNRHMAEAPDEILISMKREIDAFAGDAPQFDDITMLGLLYHGPSNAL